MSTELPDKEEVSVSDHTIPESLFQLVHAVKRRRNQEAERLGLDITPMHIRVIKIIDRKGPCTAVDIAGFLGRDKAQITRLLNTLISRKLITREPNPADRRSHYLRTTEAGRAIAAKIEKIDEATLARMTAGLTGEELAEFLRICGVMADNLRTPAR